MAIEPDKPLFSNPSEYALEAKLNGSEGEANGQRKEYDYIIVGGGTAGSVLASRLTEDDNVKILVIEAGKDHQDIIETKIPVTFSKLFHGEHDWNYYTTPQIAVNDRELYWPRGRMIGGSSSMNAMMHHHCSHSDFDEWEKEFGCTGWGYKDVLPYMRRSEKFTPNKGRPAIDAKHRGDEGMWQTGYSYLSKIGEEGFVPGCEEIGIPCEYCTFVDRVKTDNLVHLYRQS
jgi:choline dehydrogenase